MRCRPRWARTDQKMASERGHALLDHVFTGAEMQRAMTRLSTASLDRTRAGARHLMTVPIVRDLAHDRRLLTIASAVVGVSAVPFRATLFDKSPRANWLVVWHQGTALPVRARTKQEGWGPWSTK